MCARFSFITSDSMIIICVIDPIEQGEGRDKADAPAAVSSKKDKHRFGRGEAVDVSDLPTTGKTVPLLDEVRATSGVGYVCVTTPNLGESTSSGPSTQSSSEQSKELLHHLSDADDAAVDVWVTCPIGVVSHRYDAPNMQLHIVAP